MFIFRGTKKATLTLATYMTDRGPRIYENTPAYGKLGLEEITNGT
jgi:hypothetical protein